MCAFKMLVLSSTKFNKLNVCVHFKTLVLGSIKFVEVIVEVIQKTGDIGFNKI